MTKNVFIPTTKGLVSATKVQTFSTEEKTQATSNIAAASVNGTYANPAWITALAASKITGTFMKAQQHAQTAYKDEANTWAETQLFQKPITVQDGGGNNVFDVTTNQIRFRSASAGYLLGPSGQCVAGEDSGGFYLAGGFTTPTKAIYIGQQLTTQIIAAAQTINNRTSEFNVIGVDGTGWGAFRAGQATFNGFLTITKTGSNGLIVNNTVGNALAIFNASAASVTDNAYWTIQTAGSDRWYVGQSVSGLTGNFEIYGTAFGGSMLTLNRTTGAMTANAATFNGLVAAPNNTLIGNSDGTSILGGLTYFRPAAGGSSGALITGTGQAWVSTLSVGGGLETTPPTNGLLVQGAATFNGDVFMQGDSGGWLKDYGFKGSAGTDLGGFGAGGASDNLDLFWIGPSYSNSYLQLTGFYADFSCAAGVFTKAPTGGWSIEHGFRGSSGTRRGGFGAVGTNDTLSYYWIGPTYSSPYMTLDATKVAFEVGPQFKADTWLNSSEPNNRLFFGTGAATYLVGYGSTPIIVRNGSGVNIFGAHATGDFSVGTASPGNSYTRLLVYKNLNERNAVTVRNDESGSGATSELILQTYANSWGIRAGSAANNSNALEIREDALGSNTLRFKMDIGGAATFSNTAKLGDFTVATLPSAASNAGYEANVTDSSVTTFGSTVAGSGSSRVKVYSNGTNWTVQAA